MRLVKEKAGIRLMKDYSRKGEDGYIYWLEGQEKDVAFSYFDAQEMFQDAVAASLEHQDGDCPNCGGELHSVSLGRGCTHRFAKECARCGYLKDEMNVARQHQILEQAGAIKRDAPSHREGRVGVKEVLRHGGI